MVAHDFTYPLGHIVTGSFWHNLDENSLHLTIADTGWGKAVWGKLYGQWIAGANIFVYDHEKFPPAAILEKIQEYHVTSLCAPPTIFRFLIHEDLTKFDLSSLKYCTIAGEALNPAVFETFKKLTGIKLMEGFGQTETTLTIATMPWMEPKPGSMGLPNPQYDVDLIDHPHQQRETARTFQRILPGCGTHSRSLARWYLLHRRCCLERRGWLPLVCRSCRRRNQEFRLPHRPIRSGKCVDDSSGCCGMCYYRST